jgi:hypothetical protein
MSQENFWEKVGSIGKAIQKGYKGLYNHDVVFAC